MFIRIASLYPKKIRQNIEQLILYAGLDIELSLLTNVLFVMFFALSLISGLLLSVFYFDKIQPLFVFMVFIVLFPLFHAIFYVIISLYADKKAKNIENVLPDFLHLFAVNLRSGLPTEKALLFSNRKEFGPLSDEIDYIGKQIAFGKGVSESLKNFSKRVRSKQVSRLVDLIIFAIKSGGKLANLLEALAEDLRGQRLTKEKIRSDISVYIIFIFIAIILGAPLLIALSSVLVEVMTAVTSQIVVETSFSLLPFEMMAQPIPIKFIYHYGLISLVLRAIMGSFVLGLVAKGSEKQGLKYLPFLIFGAVVIYLLVRKVLSALLLTYFTL